MTHFLPLSPLDAPAADVPWVGNAAYEFVCQASFCMVAAVVHTYAVFCFGYGS